MSVDIIKEDKIAVITINRPRAFNSLDVATYREFHERLVEFRDDSNLLVGIIIGEGSRAFSIGADIKEMLPYLKEHRNDPESLPATIMRGMDIYKPLIAAINGMALGGGLEIALACDIRIASDKARFGFPEVTLGLMPGWGGTQRLVRQLAYGKAAELIFTGKMIDANEAFRIGLVNAVVPQEKVLETAREWANVILQSAPLAVRAVKEAMLRGKETDIKTGLNIEAELCSDLLGTSDFTEGLLAHEEKRKPDYKGK
jgi:enoyl-CoA hydratase/carnithine racemase